VIEETSKAIIVNNTQQCQDAAVFLGKVKQRYKRLEDLRKEFVAPMNEAVKKINAKFKMFTEPLECIEEKIKGAIASYMKEEERKAKEEFDRKLEEERKINEENERKAIEAMRLEEEAQKAIVEATNKKQREEAAKLAEEAKRKASELEKSISEIEIPNELLIEETYTIR
jgi:membrane protein involved in colicin uptake